jgi:hypothetical protein
MPHRPWAAANPQLNVIQPTYDVKKMEGARVGRAKWANISLRNADGLCGLYKGCSGGDRQIEVQHYQQLTAISECLRRAFNL